jgi:hypothetical protein
VTADRLLNMLMFQERLQRETYKIDVLRLEPEARVQFIKDQILAATDELHEALNETSWKPWSSTFGEVAEDAYFGELIDLIHFVMNLLLVAYPGLEPEALAPAIELRYLEKRKINVQRQEDGYDGRSGKCYGCGRALDDPTTVCGRMIDNEMFCAGEVAWFQRGGLRVP